MSSEISSFRHGPNSVTRPSELRAGGAAHPVVKPLGDHGIIAGTLNSNTPRRTAVARLLRRFGLAMGPSSSAVALLAAHTRQADDSDTIEPIGKVCFGNVSAEVIGILGTVYNSSKTNSSN